MRLPTLLMGLLLTAGNAAAQPSWHGLALGMPAGGAAAVLREEGESVVEHRAENGAIELSFAARGPIEKHVTLHFVRDRLQTMLIEYYAPDWNPHGGDALRCDALFQQAKGDLARQLDRAVASRVTHDGVTSVRLVRRTPTQTAELVEESAANVCATVFATLSAGDSPAR